MNDELEPLDPRLLSYLRARADVDIPKQLGVSAFDRVRPGAPVTRSGSPVARMAAIAGLAAVLVIGLLSFTLGSRPTIPPASPGSPGSPAASHFASGSAPPATPAHSSPIATSAQAEIGADGFPTSVLG